MKSRIFFIIRSSFYSSLFLFMISFLFPHQVFAKKIMYRLESDSSFYTVDTTDRSFRALQTLPEVNRAEEVVSRKILATPNDTYYPDEWHLEKIVAPEAWDLTQGSADVVVAIIDSGADTSHPDLKENIWVNENEIADNGIDDDENGYIDDVEGWDFILEDNNPNPDPDQIDNNHDGLVDFGVDHGTHVAGIIGAVGNNNEGVVGVNWNARLMILKVADDEGLASSDDIVAAINYARSNGADVMNLSLGDYSTSSFERDAVELAIDEGILMVAAVGNDNIDLGNDPIYPACYSHVLGVAATNENDDKASFSNYGECVDISAPGENILSTFYNGQYGFISGTSMSSPIVAGAAALLLSYQPSLFEEELRNILKTSATDMNLSGMGSGGVNVYAALTSAQTLADLRVTLSLSAYTSSSKKKIVKEEKRTNEDSPYFSWKVKNATSEILGYYVYFGKNKNAKPKQDGSFQSDRFYHARGVEGNDKYYYLKIRAVDVGNKLSDETFSWTYFSDTKILRPELASQVSSIGIILSWKKQKTEHIKNYRVYRALGKKSDFQYITKTKDYGYIDRAIFQKNKKIVRYKIKAIDNLENSRYSKEQEVELE